jgi:hypothetical protein
MLYIQNKGDSDVGTVRPLETTRPMPDLDAISATRSASRTESSPESTDPYLKACFISNRKPH